MARILTVGRAEDGVEAAYTEERIDRWMGSMANADPREHVLLAEAEGAVVALGAADWRLESQGTWRFEVDGCVAPGFLRRGIGRAILSWQEARLAEEAAAIDDQRPRVYHAWACETRPARKALLTGEGYAPYSYISDMVRPTLRDIPAARLPESIEIRPVRPEHYRAIFLADDEANRDHVGHREATEEDFERFTSGPAFDPGLWRVAWEGEEVVGMVRSFVNEDENAAYDRLAGLHRARLGAAAVAQEGDRPGAARGVARGASGTRNGRGGAGRAHGQSERSPPSLRERGLRDGGQLRLVSQADGVSAYSPITFTSTRFGRRPSNSP
jgi:hypothetical protein